MDLGSQSSLDDYLYGFGEDRPLPMEQDTEDSATANSSIPESKADGFVTVTSKPKQKSRAQSATNLSQIVANSAGKPVKTAATAAAPVPGKAGKLQGTTTAEYGFRYHNPSGDHLVYIVLYKVEKCNRKPCARTCEKYHSIKERRRNPLQFDYCEQPCQHVKASNSARAWGDPTKCPDGDDCEFSHTLLEQMYHPNIYKTGMCNKFTSDPSTNSCSWGLLCTHAHGPQDREKQVRALAKFRELVAAGITEWNNEPMPQPAQAPVPVSAPTQPATPSASDSSKTSAKVASSAPATAAPVAGQLHIAVNEDDQEKPDPILKTPVDVSPAYDATMNRPSNGAPFLSSFSNVTIPNAGSQVKPNLDRPSSLTEKNPIGPAKKVQTPITSPLSQALKMGALPVGVVSPAAANPTPVALPPNATSQLASSPTKNMMLQRALSGPSSIQRNGASPAFSALPNPSENRFPMLNRPASVSTLVGPSSVFGDRTSDGIWSGFSSGFARSSWEGNNSELTDSRSIFTHSSSATKAASGSSIFGAVNSMDSNEELKLQVERLQAKVTCPACNLHDRCIVLIPCKHFLCASCSDDSHSQKKCMQCNEDCDGMISVNL